MINKSKVIRLLARYVSLIILFIFSILSCVIAYDSVTNVLEIIYAVSIIVCMMTYIIQKLLVINKWVTNIHIGIGILAHVAILNAGISGMAYVIKYFDNKQIVAFIAFGLYNLCLIMCCVLTLYFMYIYLMSDTINTMKTIYMKKSGSRIHYCMSNYYGILVYAPYIYKLQYTITKIFEPRVYLVLFFYFSCFTIPILCTSIYNIIIYYRYKIRYIFEILLLIILIVSLIVSFII